MKPREFPTNTKKLITNSEPTHTKMYYYCYVTPLSRDPLRGGGFRAVCHDMHLEIQYSRRVHTSPLLAVTSPRPCMRRCICAAAVVGSARTHPRSPGTRDSAQKPETRRQKPETFIFVIFSTFQNSMMFPVQLSCLCGSCNLASAPWALGPILNSLFL